MIKLKDILLEDVNMYSVDVFILADSDANLTDIINTIRATRKITTVNINTPDNLETKNRIRTDGKSTHTAVIKFVGGKDPQQDLDFFKTTLTKSDKGDEEFRARGLRNVIFKPETLTRI